MTRMQHKDIEMVRQWRNAPHVNKHMFYQQHITKEEQEAWFAAIPDEDRYWIISADKPVGMCNLKNVIKGHQGEIGIFIGEQDYLNSTIAFKAMLQVHDYAFGTLKLQYTIAKARKENTRAIRFDKAFGYTEVLGGNSGEVIMTLSANTYFNQRHKYDSI